MPRRKPTTTPAPAGSRLFPVYRELKIGGGSKRALLQALDRDGCYVGNCARDMIARTSFASAESPRTIKLARAQLRTLGFTEWVAWSDVLKAAAKIGAEKLPAEAAARLRLELADQQPGDHFWILMDPITGADGEPYVFYLASHDDGERRLLGRYVSSIRRFFPHREIVFGVPG
ncbi:MAG TPA: hypothetical protein VG145_07990 [Xanthobacteraceae bacterium]|nr:hypothetical protein [Xanthobacteraceae bacterium]